MGNNICGEKESANTETILESNNNSPAPRTKNINPENNTSYDDRHEVMAGKIQIKWRESKEQGKQKEELLNRVRVLDDNFSSLGKFLTVEEALDKTGPGARALDKKIGPFCGTALDKSQLAQKLVFRKPFQYYMDGSIYHGFWNLSGLREGYGYLIRPDGSKLEGLWLKGEIFKGRIIDADGCYYEGKIKSGEANGEGSFFGSSGLAGYIGNWKDGVHHGYGMWMFKDKTVYKGNFSENEFNVNGTITWVDKSYYEGGFANSVITGHGIFKSAEGHTYNGMWSNNSPNGTGKYTWNTSDKKYYCGEYKNGRKDGEGIYVANGNRYEGKFMNNKPHGIGTYETKSFKVTGTWRHGYLFKATSQTSSTLPDSLYVNVDKEIIKEPREMLHVKQVELTKDASPSKLYKAASHHKELFALVEKSILATNLG